MSEIAQFPVEPNVVDRLQVIFGTQAAIARFAGRKQNSVSDWKKDNLVPAAVMRSMLIKAKAEGVDLSPLDFFPWWRGEGAA